MNKQMNHWAAGFAAALLIGCSSAEQASTAKPAVAAVPTETPTSYAVADAPPDLRQGIEAAGAAMAALKKALGGRLKAAIKDGGPHNALQACHDDAASITASTVEAGGIAVGRTSTKLRNPKNSAPPWMQAFLESTRGKTASQVQARVFDLGDRVGLVRPIGTIKLCLTCHGAAESLDPKVKDALAESYPEDAAVGFEPGDLRGLFWAEAPKTSLESR